MSSPAIEPTTSGQRARSSEAAIAWADPGRVTSTSSEPGFADLDRQVAEEAAQAVLAGRVGVGEARRQGVDADPIAVDLDQLQLGDVAADRRLRRPEAAVAERGGELLLGPDRPLLHEVADRPLAELLHHLHRRAAPRYAFRK